MKKKHCIEKIFAGMLALTVLGGAAACGNSSDQTDSGQSITGQMEKELSGKDDVADPFNESVVGESEPDTEILEDMSGGMDVEETKEKSESNILVAYFSRVGNMDFDENIDAVASASVNMDGGEVCGNARLLAGMVQEITGGDLFFIETLEKYPAEYRRTTDQAKTEQNQDARPELLSHVENMDVYDTVVLIYPNWWGTLPQPVFTFLEEYDFSSKNILPLCTHEGSRMGRSESDIMAVCPDAQLLDGLSVRGSDAGNAQIDVEEWISSSGILE